MDTAHHLDHSLLKLPRCEAFCQQMEQAIMAIYGDVPCKDLIAVLHQSRNHLKASSFGVNALNADDYLKTAAEHLEITQKVAEKL